jgi:hypothetical protein
MHMCASSSAQALLRMRAKIPMRMRRLPLRRWGALLNMQKLVFASFVRYSKEASYGKTQHKAPFGKQRYKMKASCGRQ